MMDKSDRHIALSWFIAGYLEAAKRGVKPIPEEKDIPSRERRKGALKAADVVLSRYGSGMCLSCEREGIVLIDGYFCERCHPDLEHNSDHF